MAKPLRTARLRGTVLAVVHKSDHSVGFYDAGSGGLEDLVALDPFPHEMAVDRVKGLAYISHFGVALAEDEGDGGNTISVVDLNARQRVGRLSCGEDRRPHGVCLDDRGRLYVTSEGASRLLIAPEPASLEFSARLPTLGRGSHIVSVTPDGRTAFVSNMATATLSVFDLKQQDRAPEVLQVGRRPEGSYFDTTRRRLYVTNRESASLSVLDVDSNRLLPPIETRPGPVRIAAADRTLIVAMYHDRSVGLVDMEDPNTQSYVPLPGKPISVSYDSPTGCAFVSIIGDRVCALDLPLRCLLGDIETRSDPTPRTSSVGVGPTQHTDFERIYVNNLTIFLLKPPFLQVKRGS